MSYLKTFRYLSLFACLLTPMALDAQTKSGELVDSKLFKNQLQSTIQSAFKETHEGWSSDEVILRNDLNEAFLSECSAQMPNVSGSQFNWTLMNMRKAGKLKTKTTQRARVDSSDVVHLAEIAARTMQDRHKVSSDRVMADPVLRAEFDEVAQALLNTAPNPKRESLKAETNVKKTDADDEKNADQGTKTKNDGTQNSKRQKEVASAELAYRIRRAAFTLRKTRKLKPELITRIADWGRVITTHEANSIAGNPTQIPEHPGIYIFRDQTGYLYIGQTENLRERLVTHMDQSHNQSLASYLKEQGAKTISIEIHSFEPTSRARETMIRRAYESELIRSRKPRFNIQP